MDLCEPDNDGKSLLHFAIPIDSTPYKSITDIPKKEIARLNLHLGSTGISRASCRASKEKRCIQSRLPFHDLDKEDQIHPGETVRTP